MITEWIDSVRVGLMEPLFQLLTLFLMLIACAACIAVICAPFVIGYCLYREYKDDKAKGDLSANAENEEAGHQ